MGVRSRRAQALIFRGILLVPPPFQPACTAGDESSQEACLLDRRAFNRGISLFRPTHKGNHVDKSLDRGYAMIHDARGVDLESKSSGKRACTRLGALIGCSLR